MGTVRHASVRDRYRECVTGRRAARRAPLYRPDRSLKTMAVTRRNLLLATAGSTAAATLAWAGTGTAAAAQPTRKPATTLVSKAHGKAKTTVVLVHGAFADSASYTPVTERLLAAGVPVRVPAVPNRSLISDSEYIASVIRSIPGPVLLVGHSYGGAVITVAGVEKNVVGLVYLSGYALQEGESLGELQGRFADSDLNAALVETPFPLPGGGEGTDVSVDVSKFPSVFAHDVDPAVSAVLAVSQRPLAAVAFSEKAPVAAWRTKPGWGIVSSNDHTINPEVERFGYRRAGIKAQEVRSSHLVMLSHPDAVVKLIHKALRSC
jgi:pimeloyl-ACP methyl ester carboxylesterase